jgi:glycosyltransferase involved in cell wall biosynthesis
MSSVVIPVIVCAKNEELVIGGTLDALLAACRHAEARCTRTFEVRVVLDDTTDGTASVVRARDDVGRIELRESHGGKVEAQRTGLHRAPETDSPPFAIFCDADVRPSEDAVLALVRVLDARPEVEAVTCPLRPLPPRRQTLLAAALHTYNARRGFSSSRTWFNGKLFAMRRWDVPERSALRARIAALPDDPFYEFDAGVTIDDIYLSRAVVLRHGPQAIAEAEDGVVMFRAPETWRGMNRYYRRMRRELERLDRLFPETAIIHRTHGIRKADLLAAAPLRERVHHALFETALAACKVAYVAERAFVRHVRRAPRRAWPPIAETKAL